MNKEIAVYDNTVSARMYLSYISEQAGGFASIGRDGKLYIKTFKYALGKKIGEGKSIIIKEKSNLKAQVIINGNHKQETTSGKNFLPNNIISQVYKGVTITKNDNGTLVLNGTSNAQIELLIGTLTLNSGDYKASISEKGSTSTYYMRLGEGTTSSSTFIANAGVGDNDFNISSTKTIGALLIIRNGITLNNVVLKPMISKNGGEYEPYTGGISPNPDFPQEISTVGNNINILACIPTLKASVGGLKNTLNDDGSITTAGKPSYNYVAITDQVDITEKLINGEVYTIKQEKSSPIYAQIYAKKADGTTTYINTYNTNKINFTADKTTYQKYLVAILSTSLSAWGDETKTITNKYMLYKGSEEVPFSRYNEGSVELKKQNKNFFNKNVEIKNAYPNVTVNQTITYVSSNATKTYVKCCYLTKGIYCISYKNGEIVATSTKMGAIVDEKNNVLQSVITWQNQKNEIIVNIQYNGWLIFATDLNAYDIQIEEGSTATPYVEHQGESYIMPIQQEMLEDDYIDDVEHHEWGKYIFTGEETILVGKVEDITFFNISVSDLSDFNYIDDKTLNYMCTHFKAIKVVDRYQNNTFFINIGKKAIFCSKEITTIDDFKAWLKSKYDEGNPVIIYYKLATPIDLQLNDEQKKVLKEIHNMDLYEDYTIIESEAEMQVNFARAEISIKLFQNFEWGAKYNFSKIRYEDGIRVFEKGDDTGNTLYINPDNMFIVDQEQIDNIYDELKDLELYSFKGDSIVDPALDIGDIVLIDGKQVLYCGSSQYSGRWKASISSEIKSKERQETTTVKKPSQKTINRRVQSSIEQIDGKIEQLVEENSEMSEKLSKHEQDINSIKDTVESMEDFTRETSSYQELHLVDTAEYAENLILTLKIYGDTEKWKELVPSTLLAPGLTVAPLGTTIDLIVDSQSRLNPSENKQVFKIRYGKKLRSLGNIRDELDIINNKVSVIRRIGLNDSGQEYVLEEEQTEELGEFKLPTLKADTYIYVREYPNLEYFCRYITDNEYIKKFATQEGLQQATVELNTKIEQTNQEIVLLARQKVGKNEVIASINLTPEKAKILAKLIELEGYTTINGGFKVDNKGNMEAVDGKFTGGEFYLYSEEDYPSMTIFREKMNYNRPYASICPNRIGVVTGNSSESSIGMSVEEGEDNAQLYVLGSGGGTWIHHNKINCTGEVWANAYKYNSKVELKENIHKFKRSAVDIINSTDIYEFNYKNNKNNKCIGLIIGEGYKASREIISDNKGVDSYSMNSISWKAIQEIDEKIEKIINILKKVPIFGRIFTKRWKK